jgi:uncharacterized protein involved in exopolysaccharide biosynthesis/Mrp family chromosome partitioning ATPase
MLFGRDYVESRRQFRDNDFLSFKGSIGFVGEPETGSFVIRYGSRDQKRAVTVAKTLAAALIEVNQAIASEHANRVSSFLEQRIEEATADVRKSSLEIATFMKENRFSNNADIVSGQYQAFLTERRAVDDAKLEVVKARIVLDKARDIRDRVRAKLQDEGNVADAVSTQALTSQLGVYEATLAEMTSRGELGDARFVRERIAALRAALKDAVTRGTPTPTREALLAQLAASDQEVERDELALALSVKREKAAEAVLEKASAEVERVPELQSEASGMTVAHGQKVKVLELLMENYLVARTAASVADNKLYVIEEPTLNASFGASKLKLLAVLVLAGFVCVILGFGAYDFLVGTVFNEKQIPRNRQVTHLGAIAHIPDFATGNLAIKCRQSESLAKVAFKLAKGGGERRGKARRILVTGADAMAGKSFAALALGVGLQSRGHSVVVLDCDERAFERNVSDYGRRSEPIAHVFDDPRSLVDHVRAAREVGKIYISPLGVKGCDVSERRAKFLTHLDEALAIVGEHFDFVILDGPPLIFSESLSLIDKGDDVVVCVPEGKIKRARLSEALETIELNKTAGAKVNSLISNSRTQSRNVESYRTYNYRVKAAS